MDIVLQMIRNAKSYKIVLGCKRNVYKKLFISKISVSVVFVVNVYFLKYMASKVVVNQWNRK